MFFRQITLSGLLVLLLGAPACANSADELIIRLESPAPNDVMVVAHRACWRRAPENSLAAIEECIRLGVDMIEIDVSKTTDGHLVLMHDETVDRTTNGSGLVAEKTLAQLQQFYLREYGGGDAAAVTHDRIPTLEQALLLAKGRVLLNLDAKGAVREEALELAIRTGTLSQVVIKISANSPDEPAILDADYLDQVHFMPIVREREDSPSLASLVDGYAGVAPVAYEVIFKSESFLADGVDEIAGQNARFWVNTMWERLAPGFSDDRAIRNPDAHWGYLIDMGVNMFQTDRPEELIAYLKSKGLR